MWQSCGWKMVCDKIVCEWWRVKKWCVCQICVCVCGKWCVADDMWCVSGKLVSDRWCVTKVVSAEAVCVWEMPCYEEDVWQTFHVAKMWKMVWDRDGVWQSCGRKMLFVCQRWCVAKLGMTTCMWQRCVRKRVCVCDKDMTEVAVRQRGENCAWKYAVGQKMCDRLNVLQSCVKRKGGPKMVCDWGGVWQRSHSYV